MVSQKTTLSFSIHTLEIPGKKTNGV